MYTQTRRVTCVSRGLFYSLTTKTLLALNLKESSDVQLSQRAHSMILHCDINIIKTKFNTAFTRLRRRVANLIINCTLTDHFANELFCQRPVRQRITTDNSDVNLSKSAALYCNNVYQTNLLYYYYTAEWKKEPRSSSVSIE